MGRFGLFEPQLLPFVDRLRRSPGLVVEGLMSHLSVAEDAAQDDYTLEQISLFESAAERLRRDGLEPRYLHLANSAGLLRFPQAHFNAVRLGLGLYGCLETSPGPAGSPDLSPAISLHSRLVGIRVLAEGRSVGYGRTFHTRRETRLGLVALGYNDGLPWSLSNSGELWIRDRRAPIVGRISMDVTAIDLTEVPEAQVGDDVIVFNDGAAGEPTVPEVARLSGTIPYEILCRISQRVRRIVRLAD
jgi:alanine racemase